jgi:hypothetical protein
MVSPQNFRVIALKIPKDKIQIPNNFEIQRLKHQTIALVSLVMMFGIWKSGN